MKLCILGALVVALTFTPAMAQERSQAEQQQMTGCLAKRAADNSYILTDEASGAQIVVVSEKADLDSHAANHKVTLIGRQTVKDGQPVFEVESIRHISNTCSPKQPN